jgi:hypothetical protein
MTVAAGRFSALGAFPASTPVSVFVTTTTTLASLYTDAINGTSAPNPVATDEYGNLAFFAVAGSYDLNAVFGDADRTVTITVQPDPSNPWPG